MTNVFISITKESRNALRRYKNEQAAGKDRQFTYSDAIEDLLEKVKDKK